MNSSPSPDRNFGDSDLDLIETISNSDCRRRSIRNGERTTTALHSPAAARRHFPSTPVIESRHPISDVQGHRFKGIALSHIFLKSYFLLGLPFISFAWINGLIGRIRLPSLAHSGEKFFSSNGRQCRGRWRIFDSARAKRHELLDLERHILASKRRHEPTESQERRSTNFGIRFYERTIESRPIAREVALSPLRKRDRFVDNRRCSSDKNSEPMSLPKLELSRWNETDKAPFFSFSAKDQKGMKFGDMDEEEKTRICYNFTVGDPERREFYSPLFNSSGGTYPNNTECIKRISGKSGPSEG